jgi:hypothetical protein
MLYVDSILLLLHSGSGLAKYLICVGEGGEEGVVRLPWSLAMISMRFIAGVADSSLMKSDIAESFCAYHDIPLGL